MGEGGGSKETADSRKGALGDISNIYGKRRLSLDPGKGFSGEERGSLQEEVKDGGFERESVGDASVFKKKKDKIDGTPQSLVDKKGKGLFAFDPKQTRKAMISDCLGSLVHRNALSDLLSSGTGSNSLARRSCGADKLGQGCISSGTQPSPCNKSIESVSKDCPANHDTVLGAGKVDCRAGPSNFSLSEPDASNCHKPPEPLNIGMDDGENALSGVPSCGEFRMSEKYCKCSFCLKATYIWADLHYQDARGRLAELKKSKRLARSLEAQSCRSNCNIGATRHTSKGSDELEFELKQHWKSLFFYTESFLARETAHLHANFLKLKELREKYKGDLAAISMVPEK